jgi:hypothetical protein
MFTPRLFFSASSLSVTGERHSRGYSLILTSILCEALMATMNIGVKVATLPVIALGVGIGVDYALYILSVILAVCAKA